MSIICTDERSLLASRVDTPLTADWLQVCFGTGPDSVFESVFDQMHTLPLPPVLCLQTSGLAFSLMISFLCQMLTFMWLLLAQRHHIRQLKTELNKCVICVRML